MAIAPHADHGPVPRVHVRHEGAPWQRRCIASLAGVACPTADERAADLVLDLSATGPSPGLRAPSLGIWHLVDGAGAPPGRLGEAALVAGCRGLVVRLLRQDGTGTSLLEEGCFKVAGHSLAATRRRVLESIALWPRRHLVARALGAAPAERAVTAPVAPRAIAPARLALARLRNLGRRLLEESVEEHWTIGLVDAPPEALLAGLGGRKVRWLPAMPAGYLADPLAPVDATGAPAEGPLMAEAYPFARRLGHLVSVDPQSGRQTPALELACHLSYPFLLRHEGALYCLPEAGASGRLQLWRVEGTPPRLEPDAVLLENFAAVDPTVIRHGGRWWLFAGDHADQDEVKLFLFAADDLRGPWRPHPLNPVRSDLRGARPAGPLLTTPEGLFRPAQDCSRSYGGALVINRVIRLDSKGFVEEETARLEPDPDGPCPDGLHTLCPWRNGSLIDGKRHGRSWRRLTDFVWTSVLRQWRQGRLSGWRQDS